MSGDGCSVVFGSECEVGCVDGYRQVGGNTVQKCIWNETIEAVQWSKPGIDCKRK